jgi:hypothetical protein
VKIYTILSESHEFLFEHFFHQSLKKYEPHVKLVVLKQEQICRSGSYYADGWKESMEQKIDAYMEAVNSPDEFFIWSDVDIEFYDKFVDTCIQELGDYDIAFQEGVGKEYCAGFFICRINSQTKKFFKFLKENYHSYSCDQQAINANIAMIKAKFLSHKFLNISFQHRKWSGQEVQLKSIPIMFHANYTVGLQHKIMLLTRIRSNLEVLKQNREHGKIQKMPKDIKIKTAFYGLYDDVTENLLSSKNEIMVSIETLRSDPTPGYPKFLYCFDSDIKLLVPPVKEGLSIKLT